jgi:hypothetical protein
MRTGRRVFPRRPGFYDTVFSQPRFWGLVVIVFALLWISYVAGILPWQI